MSTQTQATRRTQADLQYLAAGTFHGNDADPKRNSRLIAHGWLYNNGEYTDLGDDLAYVTRTLTTRGRFDRILDAFGLPEYVDVIETFHARTALVKFAEFLSVAAVVSDVIEAEPGNFGLVEDAAPVRRMSYRSDSGNITLGVKVVTEVHANINIVRRIEREAESRGYYALRTPDGRTKKGKSNYKTTIFTDEEEFRATAEHTHYVGRNSGGR